MEVILYYIHYALLLMFGVAASAAFAGVTVSKGSLARLLGLTGFCGALQLAVYILLGETAVWNCYPFITHLPIILALHFMFGKGFSCAVSATASAYLCCQPAKWLGLAVTFLGGNQVAQLLVRILVLLTTLAVILRWFADKLARIYGRGSRSSWIFGIIPVVYYVFDYAVGVYSSLWADSHQLVVEFLPFMLCLGHLFFCSIYYREYELKNEAQRKEQLLQIKLEQQAKEVETIRRSEKEIRLLRHDLHLFLNSLSSCIEQSDKETAQKLIAGFSDRATASAVKRYCGNDTLNYVLSAYAAQCREKGIQFLPDIELAELHPDEMLFSSILANALDNAVNAQEGLSEDRRVIRLMLKNSSGKTLLCVKNTCAEAPAFRDGLPVTSRVGHGNGAVSIQYATEKLGGNLQFVMEDEWFVLRVVV